VELRGRCRRRLDCGCRGNPTPPPPLRLSGEGVLEELEEDLAGLLRPLLPMEDEVDDEVGLRPRCGPNEPAAIGPRGEGGPGEDADDA